MRHIHFIGIGGIGVSGIAQLALKRGDKVSGSDIKESAITQRLLKMGIQVFIGHEPKNLSGADLVVYSSAIRPDNPEVLEARKAGVAIMRRAEFLSVLMAEKKVIAITGAHGKTTTSSLAAKLLLSAGFNPSVAVGGILREDGDNAKAGSSDYFVAEADESDGSFLCYTPMYSIITNIDYEHMDFYKTYEKLLDSFKVFVSQTKQRGAVFYYFEDEDLGSIVKNSGVRAISYGFDKDADFYPENIILSKCRLEFECFNKGKPLGAFSLALAGRHNILNALAVIALGVELKIDLKKIKSALAGFRGVERRFQVKYEDEDILIVDDYGHHPTEIQATIEAAKAAGRKRLVVVFQPHRYTRTHLLFDRFAKSFLNSDYLMITDIYAASEEPIAGVSSQAMVDNIKKTTHINADYVPKPGLIMHLRKNTRKGDCVLFLGAGDITKVSDEFAKSFQV